MVHVASAVTDVVQQHDDEEEESVCSVDTEDAFLDMLGLKKEENASTPILVMDEDPAYSPTSIGTPTTIPLPSKCSRYGYAPSSCAAVTIDNFCSKEECQAILQLARQNARGFDYITEASHVDPSGTSYTVQLQNPNPHKLAVLEDPATMDLLWKRLVTQCSIHTASWLKPFQTRTDCGPPTGLNPRLRVLQYDARDDDRFEPHFDATTQVNHYTSRITVLLYLNSGDGGEFEGGETLFLDSHISHCNDDTAVKITPQTGTLVLFEHDLYHSGAPLKWGTKHVLRTDILFRKENETEVKEEDEPVATTSNISDNPPWLVRDLCQSQHWTATEQSVLDDMGLLQSTIDSFLVPGTALLAELMVEGGVGKEKIEGFLTAAQEQAESNKE